jgi:hypothetical protein
MTERDINRGAGFQPGSTYAGGGNPAREMPPSNVGSTPSVTPSPPPPNRQAAGQSAAGTLKDKVADDWQAVKSSARTELNQVTQEARTAAGNQKNYAAERVSGVADAIEKVGSELEQGDQPEVGRYAKQIGSSIQRFAGDMKGKDMGEIAAMAEDFGRRQPAAFIGIAALAGFAASRFLTASAERRPDGARMQANKPAAGAKPTTTTSPVGPTTGANTATGYPPEGSYNG